MIEYYIFGINCVLTFVYSQCSRSPYQPLRADIEGNGSQARNKRK